MKKNIIAILSVLFASTAFADELRNYDAVTASAIGGKTLHYVINFANCATKDKQLDAVMSFGVITPSVLSVMGNHVATSMIHFTLNNPVAMGKPAYEYARYTLTDNGNMSLEIRVFDAATYVPYEKEWRFDCQLGNGVRIYS